MGGWWEQTYDSTVTRTPSRITSALGEWRAASASSAAPARLSCVKPKIAFAITIMIITTDDAYSPKAAAIILYHPKHERVSSDWAESVGRGIENVRSDDQHSNQQIGELGQKHCNTPHDQSNTQYRSVRDWKRGVAVVVVVW